LYEIPFNQPFTTGKEFDYIRHAIENGHISGNGPFTKKCQYWLEKRVGCQRALLTNSCTAALEMAALLIQAGPGDEIIMPSFTFVSTANAFVLRGAKPVFVDIRADTLNLDETRIEESITPQTKAIVVVHYAGVACAMNAIMEIAVKYDLIVIEDAAQAVMSSYLDGPLGAIGHLAAFSFHETKNVISGEGGALLINEPNFIERAEVIWEKGTNRCKFFRGEVDKYTWTDIGSSYLPSDLNAAFLFAQFEEADSITADRLKIWNYYQSSFLELEGKRLLRRPIVPPECKHNAHMYYLLLEDRYCRSSVLKALDCMGVNAVFHYVPLHSSPAGLKYGRTATELPVTDSSCERLIRLPLWVGMTLEHAQKVVAALKHVLNSM
tara:strand:- start:114 stop:1253 length:1140 start_codon:yes stop_codon:yes gene_type:complete